MPEDWLARGNPWEFKRPETDYSIGFGGAVEYLGGDDKTPRATGIRPNACSRWPTTRRSPAGAAATSTRCGCGRPAPPTPIQLADFNKGDYVGAVAARARAEAISRVLYPNDATAEGQELRLRQEYFFTAASLQDIVGAISHEHGDTDSLPDHAAVQLNDTHPAIAVAELMRILVDDHECSWEDAWRITKATLNYTNHTLLPEALETWPVDAVRPAAAAPSADHLPDQLACTCRSRRSAG